MRKVAFLSILGFLLSFSLFAQKAEIEFTKLEHNFGEIKEADGVVSYAFAFKNTGNAPLALQNVEASCGCTSPEWTKEPILAGKSGIIKVAFDPKDRPEPFEKTVRVTSNAEKNNVVTLIIKGDVKARVLTIEEQYPYSVDQLRFKGNVLEMFRVVEGNIKTETIEVYNSGKTPVIANFENVPSHISVKADPVSLPAGAKGTIRCTYNASKKNEFGQVSDNVTVRVKTAKGTLTIRATIDEDFSKLTSDQLEKAPVFAADETNIQFGSIKKGDKITKTVELKNDGKSDLIIRKISNDSEYIKDKVSKTTIKSGETATLSLELTAKDAGEQFYTTTVTTNAPKQRQITFYMIGTVE